MPRTFFAVTIAIAVVVGLLAGPSLAGAATVEGQSLKQETFRALETIRSEKKAAVLARLDRLAEKSRDTAADPMLLKPFRLFGGRAPFGNMANAELAPLVDELDRHYVDRYGDFYDILFIADDGLVFYSIKLESDFNHNMFRGPLARTRLSKSLRGIEDTGFIDYDHYYPSDEPASFFVTRVKGDGGDYGPGGWIVLQFSINALNAVLADYDGLGETGEVYLTNTDKVMLTQSRLLKENTALRQRVDTLAPETALTEGAGALLLDDYRGVRVFSAFEQMTFADTVWIIVAEIDEDEVLTRHFSDHRDTYMPLLLAAVGTGVRAAPPQGLPNHAMRVDINEYGRGPSGRLLYTRGVSTCTAVSVQLPGRFSYLGHIYPLDSSYMSPVDEMMMRLGLRLNSSTPFVDLADLLGEMLLKINRFDITPAETARLRVVLAAIHTNGFPVIIDRLLKNGLFLSQIKVLYGPGMRYANMNVGPDVRVEWVGHGDATSSWARAGERTLSDVLKEVSGYGT